MEFHRLGSIVVPAIGLGTARTFDVTSEADVAVRRRIIDECVDHQVTFLDSSPMYGNAEKVTGIVTEGEREKFQFATKVWCQGKERGGEQIARSFELLRTDFIEVFQIHNLVDWRTHLPTLERLKEEGKIGLIGITHYSTSSYPTMMEIMKTGRVEAVQVPYNVGERTCEARVLLDDYSRFILAHKLQRDMTTDSLIDRGQDRHLRSHGAVGSGQICRGIEEEPGPRASFEVALAQELGIGVIVMEPLGVGRYVAGLKRSPDLEPLSKFGITTWGQALLAWVLADGRVSVAIPATSRPERIAENAMAGNVPWIPQELRDYIQSETHRCR